MGDGLGDKKAEVGDSGGAEDGSGPGRVHHRPESRAPVILPILLALAAFSVALVGIVAAYRGG